MKSEELKSGVSEQAKNEGQRTADSKTYRKETIIPLGIRYTHNHPHTHTLGGAPTKLYGLQHMERSYICCDLITTSSCEL